MVTGVGDGDADWVGVCFVGPLAELETEGWRQVVGLDLLREGTGATGTCVGITGVMVCVGVWAGAEVRVRDI